MESKMAKFIKESCEWLIENQQGCCMYKLDNRLGVAVGWSEGFGDEPRNDVVQAKDDKDLALVAGLKVWTSDDLGTDYDYYNFPYSSNGDVIDFSWNITQKEIKNPLCCARYFIQLYGSLKNLTMDKNGLILNEEE